MQGGIKQTTTSWHEKDTTIEGCHKSPQRSLIICRSLDGVTIIISHNYF